MKVTKLFAMLLVLAMLLGACSTAPESTETTIPATEPVLVTEPAQTLSPETQPSETEFTADLFDIVFDTSSDEGHLTARYLYMDKSQGTDANYVYPGDCTVYTSPDGYVMVVDASNQVSGDDIIAQLNAIGITKIDVLAFSHPHADHVGAFCQIADTFPIGQVYTNGHDYDSVTYQNCVSKMKELNIPCQALVAGDSFMLGEQVHVQIYGPQPGKADNVAEGYQDANDTSLAMRITYGDSSFWTSGDLYVSGEELIMDMYGEEICSDVVKLNHHGKDTSNGRNFAKYMKSLIAVGMYETVGSVTVARRFQAAGAMTFYNSCDGAIRVSTTGDGTYEVQTQFLRDLSVLPAPSADGAYTISRAE